MFTITNGTIDKCPDYQGEASESTIIQIGCVCMCMCVCLCMHVCVGVCVHAWVCVCIN